MKDIGNTLISRFTEKSDKFQHGHTFLEKNSTSKIAYRLFHKIYGRLEDVLYRNMISETENLLLRKIEDEYETNE
jgi:hypothetical protein